MEKADIIKNIRTIIERCGNFGSGEVEIGGETSSPCVNSMGGLVALAEYFTRDEVDIEVYEPDSMSSDSMHSYKMEYKELDEDTLIKILEMAEYFEADQEKTAKRIED